MDRASLFTETVHCYLPKLCTLIYRNCVSLIAETCVLLFTDHNMEAELSQYKKIVAELTFENRAMKGLIEKKL